MNVAKVDLEKKFDRIVADFWKVNDALFERLNTNSDAKFERSENFDKKFDEVARFDVKENEKIIDRENEKDRIDRILDCNADFRLSIEKNIDCENVEEIDKVFDANFELSDKKIIDSENVEEVELETTNFDLFAW